MNEIDNLHKMYIDGAITQNHFEDQLSTFDVIEVIAWLQKQQTKLDQIIDNVSKNLIQQHGYFRVVKSYQICNFSKPLSHTIKGSS